MAAPEGNDASTEASPRADLLALVRQRRVVTLGEARRALQIPAATLHFHVERLEREGALRSFVAGRRRLLCLPEETELGGAEIEVLSLLRGATMRRVAISIRDGPGLSIADIRIQTGATARVVYYHVDRLRSHGLILNAGRTRYSALAPTPLLNIMLARLDEQSASCAALQPELPSQG